MENFKLKREGERGGDAWEMDWREKFLEKYKKKEKKEVFELVWLFGFDNF